MSAYRTPHTVGVNLVRLCVTLEQSQIEALRREARENERSLSAELRMMLRRAQEAAA